MGNQGPKQHGYRNMALKRTGDGKKTNQKAYIKTFGCQMNEYDSERIAYHLTKAGYTLTGRLEGSDLIVLNTCAVREKAKNRLYGHIGNLKKHKQENPHLIIAVGGCTAQNLRADIQKDFPFVDIVFGTFNVSQIAQLVAQKQKGRSNICGVKEQGFDYQLGQSIRPRPFKAFVPVITGCNNFCSYCIVPFVRGREKSLPPEAIAAHIKDLAHQGVKEVTLLGQNVNSYGKDLDQAIDFSSLLEKMDPLGIPWIRFMTSHPKDFSPKLVKVVAGCDHAVNHIHLPLQSGSNAVLEKMNRKYTQEHYLGMVQGMKANMENCSITTDIMVGFPGEEEKDFKQTMHVVKKARFKRAFTFIYSPRERTAAAKIKDDVPLASKKKWFEELVAVQNRISYEENKKMEGKTFQALVEGYSPKDKGLLQARLYDHTVVLCRAPKKLIGKMVYLEIKQAKAFYLIGNYQGKC